MESQTVIIRYERLPEFCSACGRLGHPVRRCSDTSVSKDAKAFGPWLRASRTQELRRSRRSDVRGNRQDGKMFGDFREEASATGGSQSREEEMGANDEGDILLPVNRPAPSIAASEDQITVHNNKGKEARQRNSCDKSSNMCGELEIGGSKARVTEERAMLEDDAHRSSPPIEQLKLTMRGWKRQARKSDNRQDTSNKTHWKDVIHQPTRKRGGGTREDENLSPKTKLPRITFHSQDEEVTAETARQSRRSQ